MDFILQAGIFREGIRTNGLIGTLAKLVERLEIISTWFRRGTRRPGHFFAREGSGGYERKGWGGEKIGKLR